MFEYLTVIKHESTVAGGSAEVEMLDRLGLEGWSLITIRTVNSGIGRVDDVYYFKRVKGETNV